MQGKETNMDEVRNIIHRLRMGESKRQIHRTLGVHRSIIRQIYDLSARQGWLDKERMIPTHEEIAGFWHARIKNQSHPLDIFKDQIAHWVKEGLSSIVIHQLLKEKCFCDVQSIRRYRKKHFPKIPEPKMIRPTAPGRDMDVDFGELGKFLDDNGQLKRVWLFSLRLRHSRKAYREIVLDQTLRTFLMGHIHAFEYFGGVPKNCIPDNTKTAVIKSTIDNDLVNRSYQQLAEYYRFVINPCLPNTPEHKGGVEGDVKYVKGNFMPYFRTQQKERGISNPKISDLIQELGKWEREVADLHIVHGVGRTPLALYEEEKQTLQHLPPTRWEPTAWYRCCVRRDWRIMLNSAYYSVPYGLIGEMVEVCITGPLVHIFHRNQEVAMHEAATKQWEYKRKHAHAPPFEEEVLNCSREGLLILAKDIGICTYNLAHTILSHPSVDKLKPVRHMLRLAQKYTKERLEKACERALKYKMHSYASVKNILENSLDHEVVENEKAEKVVQLPRPRFARDPADYKSDTFQESLERTCPYSRHGNAMKKDIFHMVLADAIIDEELREKEINFTGLAEQ
jgi:transposase